MRIQQFGNQLVLNDSAGCFWLFGLFFVCIGGIFVLGPLGLFSNVDEVELWVNILALGTGLIGVGAGIHIWRESPFSTVLLDRDKKKLWIERRWLIIRSATQYAWQEIVSIDLRENEDSEGDSVYRIEMQLSSGEYVPLSHLWLSDKASHETTLQIIRKFGGW